MIQEYFATVHTTEQFLKFYETEEGKKAYDETLAVVKKNFPQYLQELQGIADGSKVSFDLVRTTFP